MNYEKMMNNPLQESPNIKFNLANNELQQDIQHIQNIKQHLGMSLYNNKNTDQSYNEEISPNFTPDRQRKAVQKQTLANFKLDQSTSNLQQLSNPQQSGAQKALNLKQKFLKVREQSLLRETQYSSMPQSSNRNSKRQQYNSMGPRNPTDFNLSRNNFNVYNQQQAQQTPPGIQMTQSDAVNIIDKLKTELEKEGNLMTEIERRFGMEASYNSIWPPGWDTERQMKEANTQGLFNSTAYVNQSIIGAAQRTGNQTQNDFVKSQDNQQQPYMHRRFQSMNKTIQDQNQGHLYPQIMGATQQMQDDQNQIINNNTSKYSQLQNQNTMSFKNYIESEINRYAGKFKTTNSKSHRQQGKKISQIRQPPEVDLLRNYFDPQSQPLPPQDIQGTKIEPSKTESGLFDQKMRQSMSQQPSVLKYDKATKKNVSSLQNSNNCSKSQADKKSQQNSQKDRAKMIDTCPSQKKERSKKKIRNNLIQSRGNENRTIQQQSSFNDRSMTGRDLMDPFGMTVPQQNGFMFQKTMYPNQVQGQMPPVMGINQQIQNFNLTTRSQNNQFAFVDMGQNSTGKHQHIYNFLKTAFQNLDRQENERNSILNQINAHQYSPTNQKLMMPVNPAGTPDEFGLTGMQRYYIENPLYDLQTINSIRNKKIRAQTNKTFGQNYQSPQLNRQNSYYGNYETPANLQNQMLQGQRMHVPTDFVASKSPEMKDYGMFDQEFQNPNDVMRNAIKQGNKNISLTTMGLKRRNLPETKNNLERSIQKEPNQTEEKLQEQNTGNPRVQNHGLANQLATINLETNNPLGNLILQKTQKQADIVIYHVEKNFAVDTAINKALKQSNELIKIANLSYYHQSKSEFQLCNKEMRLLKACGVILPRHSLDSKTYFKSREFQVLLKDRALKLLVTMLQKAQGLPVTLNNFNNKDCREDQNMSIETNVKSPPTTAVTATARNHTPQKREKTPQLKRKKSRGKSPMDKKTTEKITQKEKEGLPTDSSFQATYFKFFVGSGNNFPLVRSVLKYRWWFQMTERPNDKCNFIWTSWFKKKICDDLIPFEKLPKQTRVSCSITKSTHLSIMPTNDHFNPSKAHIYGRMDQNFHLANKKCLFYAMKEYYEQQGLCVFKDKVFPVTFHVKDGLEDKDFQKLIQCFEEFPNSVWIVKPGENSNRGVGIQVSSSLKEIEAMVLERQNDSGQDRTIIIQKYIEKPLLVYKRKFDIRVFGMLTCVNGLLRGYFYEEGYLRTSSKEYNLKALNNKYIHLTNDAIQQTATDFGKFESGNKLSFSDFQKYLKITEDLKDEFKGQNGRVNFYKQIMPQMRHLVTEAFRSVAHNKIDPERKNFSFEIFGFDFMIDEDFTVYLIEANTNPCLETNSAILSRIIPVMLDASFRIAVDPILPPPELNFKRAHEALHENKYIQVFDEAIEGETLKNLHQGGGFMPNNNFGPASSMMTSMDDDLRIGNKLRELRTGLINNKKPRLPSQNTDMNQFILSDLIVQQIQNKNAGRHGKKKISILEKGIGLETARPLRSRSKLENNLENTMIEGRSINQLDKSAEDLMDITVRSNIYSSLHELSDRIDNGTPMSILKTLGETPHALQNQKYEDISQLMQSSPVTNEISRYGNIGQEREMKKQQEIGIEVKISLNIN